MARGLPLCRPAAAVCGPQGRGAGRACRWVLCAVVKVCAQQVLSGSCCCCHMWRQQLEVLLLGCWLLRLAEAWAMPGRSQALRLSLPQQYSSVVQQCAGSRVAALAAAC